MAGCQTIPRKNKKQNKTTKFVVHLKFFPSICIYLYVTCGRGAVVQKDFKNSEITSIWLNFTTAFVK